MVRWLCNVKQQDTVPSKGMRDKYRKKQVAMVWPVLQNEEHDWVKKCMEFEAEG